MSTPSDSPQAPSPGNTATLARVLGGALLVGLLGAGGWQKTSGGLQIELIALAGLLAPLGGLALYPMTWAGLRSPAGPLLGVVALFAVGSVAVAEWGLCVAAFACAVGISGLRAERALPAAPWLARVAVAGAVAVTAAGLALGLFHSVLKLLLLAPLVWEAFAGWRARTATAELRRAACGWLLITSPLAELVRGSAWEGQLPITPGLVAALGVAWVAAGRGLREAPDPAQRKRVRRTLLKVGTPLVMLLLCLVGGELLFRVVPNSYRRRVLPDPHASFHEPHGTSSYLGWNYAEPEYDEPISIRWNAHGWFDVDHELEKPQEVRRLLVVGDSYVEAIQVALEDHYHLLLEAALAERSRRPVEAIAYGWSGWGQHQELAALTEGVSDGEARNLPNYPAGLDYGPELVVLEVLPANDVLNNLPELERLANAEQASALRRQFARSLERGLYFSAFLADKSDLLWKGLTGVKDPIDAGVFQESPVRYPELWGKAWRRTEELLQEIRAAVEARGARFVVVLFTSTMELAELRNGQQGPYRFRSASLRLVELCERLGIPCLDLAPQLAEHDEVHLVHDGHWSAKGHRLAAEATARWLLESGHWPAGE